MILALVLLRFVSGSLLAAMGDACGGIFAAGHGFLAASSWNYLLAIAVAAAFLSQLGFLIGGGSRLLRVSHKEKLLRRVACVSCPALPVLNPLKWAAHVSVYPGDKRLQAQTVGLLQPRIVLTEGLVRTLDRQDLEAVVAHEEAHRAARDNLFLVIAKSVALTLFYLPGPMMAFRELQSGLERAADQKASETVGDRLVVAGALARIAVATKAVSVSGTTLSTAVTGNGADLTDRLEELVDGKSNPALNRRRLALFTAGIIVTLAVFTSSALAVAGSDQRQSFICFTQHEQRVNADGVCEQDHPLHP